MVITVKFRLPCGCVVDVPKCFVDLLPKKLRFLLR